MQVLVGLAVFLLAVNLAYVRFETFEHRKRIRRHASASMGLRPRGQLKNKDFYKRLEVWAGKEEPDEQTKQSIGEQLGWWGQTCQFLFDGRSDQKIANLMVWVSTIVVGLGTTHVSGQWTIPGEDKWIGTLWFVLELMTLVSVGLVLAGNSYISRVFRLIDEDTKHRNTFLDGMTSAAKTTSDPEEVLVQSRRGHSFTSVRAPKGSPNR